MGYTWLWVANRQKSYTQSQHLAEWVTLQVVPPCILCIYKPLSVKPCVGLIVFFCRASLLKIQCFCRHRIGSSQLGVTLAWLNFRSGKTFLNYFMFVFFFSGGTCLGQFCLSCPRTFYPQRALVISASCCLTEKEACAWCKSVQVLLGKKNIIGTVPDDTSC